MSTKSTPNPRANRQRRPDRSMRLTILGSLATLVIFAAIIAGAYLLLRPGASAGGNVSQPAVIPPLRLTQQAELNSYGWKDKAAGAAHIPIDRAMQIIATQGIPTMVALPDQSTTPQP
jgi:hypothetical protein